MKKATQTAIMVAIACILIGCAIAATALAIVNFDFIKLSTVTQVTNHFVIEEKVRSFDIRTSAANIVFAPSPDDSFTVECVQSDRITVNVEVEGNTLKITEQDNRKWYEYIGIFYYDAHITVYIPVDMENNAFDHLYLKTTSGDITIEDPHYRYIDTELHTTSGDILYHAFTVKTLTIETVSGDVDAGNYPMGVVQISTSGGDVNLPAMTGSFVSVSTSDGDITADHMDALGLNISTSSGDVTADHMDALSLNISTVSGDVELSESISDTLTVHTTDGDILLRRFDAETLGIKTTGGDVTCHLLSPKNYITHTSSGLVDIPPSVPLAGNCEIQTKSGDIRIKIV